MSAPPRPAYQEAADRLRSQIASGAIAPGARLPVEGELAASFGVSRSTIREALRLLGSEGLIRTVRGVAGGSFVAESGLAAAAEHLGMRLTTLVDRGQIGAQELREARVAFETALATLAARRRTEADLAALREALADEDRFHALLLATARSGLLEAIAAPVVALARARSEGEGETPDWARDEHERILARIEAGDEAGAATALGSHLARLAGA